MGPRSGTTSAEPPRILVGGQRGGGYRGVRVGEASRLVGVPAYVLRFWETEFRAVSPQKSGRGHRLYRRKDVELLLQIKHLLYEKRYDLR